MYDELKRMEEDEMVVAYLRYYTDICLEEVRKTMKNII
jgi:hypothetical protein